MPIAAESMAHLPLHWESPTAVMYTLAGKTLGVLAFWFNRNHAPTDLEKLERKNNEQRGGSD